MWRHRNPTLFGILFVTFYFYSTKHMNIKKLFSVAAVVTFVGSTFLPGLAQAETPDTELGHAYEWAHSKGITTMDTYEKANMYGAITRAEMAKMLSVYATEILGKTADTSKACEFSDIASVGGDLKDFIVKSCQLSVMGQNITAFRPYDTITRAEFGTALSRVLWGDTYNNGTPYYANHLNALKEAGIMKQIANADSTKEIRGYVMIMLQRASEGEDKDLCEMCLATGIGADKCEAVCGNEDNGEEDNNEDVVKSWDLDVSSAGNTDGKLFIGRASELDTITLKTSEEVTISKIILEREWYSSKDNIKSVWLEDENGAKIAEAKGLDSKGQVKLTLKKDYKAVDGELVATIVVESYDATSAAAAGGTAKALQAWATVGFKVVDVESTAKATNISAKANTYTAIAFDGSKISFTSKPTTKTYNYEAGELYEVAKFKVNTPDDSAIILRGFTFENTAMTKLDLKKFLDKAEVTIAGEKVSGLEASVNKDNELVVSFKDVEVAAKKKAEVIVKVSLTEDFDDFGTDITYKLKDFVAVDGKVEARVGVTGAYPTMTAYTFKGGKIKLANTKLWNVDAAQNSEEIQVAEGTITVPEAIKGSFIIKATGKAAGAIKTLTFWIGNDDTPVSPAAAPTYAAGTTYGIWDLVNDGTNIYESLVANNKGNTPSTSTTSWQDLWTIPATTKAWLKTTDVAVFKFNNVEIDESGKIKFTIDTNDDNIWETTSVEFDTFKTAAFSSLVYDESNEDILTKWDIAGSISFSKVTIQPAKASLSNSLTKDVEFMNKATRTETVFEGTYTAKKGDIDLNEFSLSSTAACVAGNNITFYLYVDDMETAVVDADAKWTPCVATDTFNAIKVKAGESVKIKVEAEVEAENTTTPVTLGKYELKIWGEDENGNTPSGEGKAKTVNMKVVDKGSVKVSDSSDKVKQTILRKANDAVLARFIIKPADGASSVDLETIGFKLAGLTPGAGETLADLITVKVAEIEEDDVDVTGAPTLVYSMNKEVPSEWVEVLVTIDDETYQTLTPVTLDSLVVNGKSQAKTFTKQYVPAAVEITSQSVSNGSTVFKLSVDADSDTDVALFTISAIADDSSCAAFTPKTIDKVVFDNGDTISVSNIKDCTYTLNQATYLYSEADTTNKAGKCYKADGSVDSTPATAAACEAAGEAWAAAGTKWTKITVSKTSLPDYFKIDDVALKVMNL